MSGQYSMLTLGVFTFELDTATYQELKRTTEYLWPSQQRFGNAPAVQSTGLGDDTIVLPGLIFPEHFGGIGQVDRMREIAAEMQPLTMIGGLGNVMGKWVITSVEETQSVFAQAGVPRRQEFSLTLKKYDDAGAEGVLSASDAGNEGEIGGIPGISPLPSVSSGPFLSVSEAISVVTATAGSVMATVSQVTGKIGSAINSVSKIAGALGIHSPAITGALNRSLSAMNGIRSQAGSALDMLGKVQTISSAASSAKGMFDSVSTIVQPTSISSSAIKSSLNALKIEGASNDTLNTVTDALVAANKATAFASSLRDNTNTILKKFG